MAVTTNFTDHTLKCYANDYAVAHLGRSLLLGSLEDIIHCLLKDHIPRWPNIPHRDSSSVLLQTNFLCGWLEVARREKMIVICEHISEARGRRWQTSSV